MGGKEIASPSPSLFFFVLLRTVLRAGTFDEVFPTALIPLTK